MTRSSIAPFIAALMLAAWPTVYRAQAPGSAAGFVLDEAGHPVAGAEATARPADRPGIGILPHSFSGADGQFLIAGLPPGTYRITAEKPQEGYGDPTWVLFESSSARAPTVEIRPGETADGVSVRLGPKGGWIAGVTLDATTGKEVRTASVGVLFASSNRAYGSWTAGRDGAFRVLLPSDKAVRVRFSARGYETFYYGADGTESHAALLRVSPGETRKLVIQLRLAPSGTR